MAFGLKGKGKRAILRTLLLTGFISAAVAVSCSTECEGVDGMHSARKKDGKFMNSVPVRDITAREYGKIIWKFLFGSKDRRVPKQPLPVVKPAFHEPPSSAMQYNWLGHSSLILEIEGKRMLLDPVFSERASFTQLLGPKRFHPAPIPLDQLPHIDLVLISHNHYDHLDRMAVDYFKDSEVRFVVPVGIKGLLVRWGVKSEMIAELDWWEDYVSGGLTVVSTPARHFSARSVFDRDETLWTSWAILGRRYKAYFSGDTGMMPEFGVIGETYGPFDITFMKMAAYAEMWPDVHLSPEEAVQAHIMLKGRKLVPIHWGTFDLAFHGWKEPIERIIAAADREHVSLLTSRIGETVIPGEHKNSFWWREVE